MSLFPCRRALQSRIHIKTAFLSAFILTRQNGLAPTESKRISIAATACRSPPPSTILSPEAHRRRIVGYAAAVITCCEKRKSQQCSWNVDFSRTRTKDSTRNLHPTVKNLRKRSRLEFVDVLLSQVTWARREWQLAKAFRCSRTPTKPTCAVPVVPEPSTRTNEAHGLNLRRRRKGPLNQLGRKRAQPQKSGRADWTRRFSLRHKCGRWKKRLSRTVSKSKH